MKLTCCSDCRYSVARARRTMYGQGARCGHPDNRDGVPQGVMDPKSGEIVCAYDVTPAEPAADRERRRIAVGASS